MKDWSYENEQWTQLPTYLKHLPLFTRQKDMTSINTKAIHTIMRSFKDWGEYKSRTVFKIYGNQRGYFRKDQILPQAEKNTTGTTGKD